MPGRDAASVPAGGHADDAGAVGHLYLPALHTDARHECLPAGAPLMLRCSDVLARGAGTGAQSYSTIINGLMCI